MAAPLVIAAAIGVGYVASQIALSVGTGYAVDKAVGDGQYTRRELATDAVLGAIPGLGLIRPSAKILFSARHLRYARKTEASATDIAAAMAYVNRANIAVIGKTIATEKGVNLLAGALIAESGRASSSSYQQSGTRPGPRKAAMVKPTWKSGGKGGKMRPSCPSGHKLRRIGKRLMCVKSS